MKNFLHAFYHYVPQKYVHTFSFCTTERLLYIEGSGSEWCISSMLYSQNTPFWSGTLDLFLLCTTEILLNNFTFVPWKCCHTNFHLLPGNAVVHLFSTLFHRNADIQSLDETFWERAFTLNSSSAQHHGNPDTSLSSAGMCVEEEGGWEGVLEEVLEATPKFLRPVMRDMVLTGKSMELLQALGRLPEVLQSVGCGGVWACLCTCVWACVCVCGHVCVCLRWYLWWYLLVLLLVVQMLLLLLFFCFYSSSLPTSSSSVSSFFSSSFPHPLSSPPSYSWYVITIIWKSLGVLQALRGFLEVLLLAE